MDARKAIEAALIGTLLGLLDTKQGEQLMKFAIDALKEKCEREGIKLDAEGKKSGAEKSEEPAGGARESEGAAGAE